MTAASFAEYLQAPGVHWSVLKNLEQSPLEYKHALDHPATETDAMRLGRAVHTAVLEPDQFLREYELYPGENRRGNAWKDFVAAHTSKTVLLEKDYQQCLAIRDAVRSHPIAGPLLEGAETEFAVGWNDGGTGIPCKARIDCYKPNTMVDLKTTGTFEPRLFAATAARLKYVHQLAFYRNGLVASVRRVDAVKIICVQSSAPHDVIVYGLPEQMLDWARGEVGDLMRLLQKCQRRDEWPGAGVEEHELDLPLWAFPDEEPLTLTKGGEPLATL